MAKAEGVEEVVIGLTYSISEVHTHEYYAESAAALAGCADMDRLYLKDPGGLLTVDAVRELAPPAAHGRRAAARAPQPLHDRAGPAGLRRGREGRVPGRCTRRRRRWAAAPPSPSASPPPATSRPPALRTGSTRCAGGGRPRTSATRRRQGTAARRAAGVRRRLLPPPAPRRHGDHDAADAGGAAPARAVRRGAGGGHAGARRDGLPDHRHARFPVHRQPGRAQRDRRRALGNVSDETVRYFLGHYGGRRAPRRPRRSPTRCSPARARELERPRADHPGRRAREVRRADLRRGTAAASDDARPAGRRDGRPRPPASGPCPSCARGRDPLVLAPCEVENRRSITYMRSRRATTWWCGAVRLDDVRGFIFDVDGTLVHRGRRGARSRAPSRCSSGSARPAAASCSSPTAATSRPKASPSDLREDGLPVDRRGDAHARSQRALLPAAPPPGAAGAAVRHRGGGRATCARTASLVNGDDAQAGVVFVAHVDEVALADLERAARAVPRRGAAAHRELRAAATRAPTG